jgi:cyanophycinase
VVEDIHQTSGGSIMSARKRLGTVVAIGGAEDRKGDSEILQEVIKQAGGSRAKIVVLTVATDDPQKHFDEYGEVFERLGHKEVAFVDVSLREHALEPERIDMLRDAQCLFFTGGDQLFITSLLGGTMMEKCMHELHEQGTVIAGTSAGAAMMGTSMIVSGTSDDNPRSESVQISPGMDFLDRMTIDTHFSQRGRHGRLLTAIAHYPRCLGVGIDEDTAIVVRNGHFDVIGSGCATVADFSNLSYSNLPRLEKNESLTLHDIRLHVLSAGHRYDLGTRRPIAD